MISAKKTAISRRNIKKAIAARVARATLSTEELATLQDLYQRMPLREVAKAMGRTYGSLVWQKHKLGLSKPYEQRIPLHPVMLPPTKLAYLAGLIDGEGTVSIRRLRSRRFLKPHFSIANTSRPLMDWLEATLSGPSIYTGKQKTKAGNTIYAFRVEGLAHLGLYRALLPFLIIKRERMALLIEWTELRRSQSRKQIGQTPRQAAIVSRIRAMNIKPLHRWNAERLSTSLSST